MIQCKHLLPPILLCFLLLRSGGAQRPDGQILFSGTEANSQTTGEVSWDYKPTRWGMYDVAVSFEGEAAAQSLTLQIAGKTLQVPQLGTGAKNPVPAGRIYLAKADPFKVVLRFDPAHAAVKLPAVTLTPAPEGEPIVQERGVLTLRAHDAITHSVMMRFEPATNKNCLGYWVNPSDTAEWRFTINTPGTYAVELWQGCGKGQGGSDVRVEVRDSSSAVQGGEWRFIVEDTGHFQNFVPRKLGRVAFTKAGDYSLWIKPQRKQAGAIMDIRQVVLTPEGSASASQNPLETVLGSKRIVFLGDSITYSGEYVDFIETYLRLHYPESSFEILNLGLPSETVSGLSEPGHAGGSFPRPDLHERLGRVLKETRPDLIFACYGMNDGIYFPFSEERFTKFQEGIRRLREHAHESGAKLILVTPPVFDPLPLKGNTLPDGLKEYPRPYQGYNAVLDRYSEWLMQERSQGWEVIDIHAPMNEFLRDQRKTRPDFILAGDGVHANRQGHWLIAREILRFLAAPADLVASDTPDALLNTSRAREVFKLVQERQRLLKDAWLTSIGHLRPGMNKGLPLAEAKARAAALSEKLRSP